MSWSAGITASMGPRTLRAQLAGGTDVTALIGPNGSGKSTLMRALAGLERPLSGRIQLGGQVLFDAATKEDLAPELRRVGYLPQGYALFPHLDVVGNVAFGLDGSRAQRRQRARVMLDALGCAALAGRRIGDLSGGEQQRVALARALVVGPRMLLLDEPMAALDVGARRETRALLRTQLRQASVPVVMITHDVRDLEALADRIVVLSDGIVVQAGTLASLREAPADSFVAELVGVSGP